MSTRTSRAFGRFKPPRVTARQGSGTRCGILTILSPEPEPSGGDGGGGTGGGGSGGTTTESSDQTLLYGLGAAVLVVLAVAL